MDQQIKKRKRRLASRVLSASLVSLCLHADVRADELAATDFVPLQITAWSETVTLRQFDPSLGILQAVELQLTSTMEGSAGFENLQPIPATGSVTWSGQIELFRPDMTSILQVNPSQSRSQNVPAFDGTIDFSGSGAFFSPLIASDMASSVATLPSPDLLLFTGMGNIVLPVTAIGTSTCQGAGNLVCTFAANADATVTVIYSFALDCNKNGIPDEDDIANGTSADCNNNKIPDDCELLGNDCNSNGVPDECDPDCDNDGIPDQCELAGNDCNNNQIPDNCELPPDCNNNGVPDACEPDCNNNGSPDECEGLLDCNQNGLPDECELAGNDCNNNGRHDDCELTGNDCNNNGIPDECEPDCDNDGLPDECENSPDCNNNNIPDQCDIIGNDCNANSIPDDCEIDCDNDGIPNDCDPGSCLPPVAGDDFAQVCQDVCVDIFILGNDFDPDGIIIPDSVQFVSPPANGVIFGNGGLYTYCPNSEFNGVEIIGYTVMDLDGLISDPASIIIEVDAAPMLASDSFTTCEGECIEFDVLATDTFPGAPPDPAGVFIATAPQNGSVMVNPINGLITYCPDPGFSGVDIFNYSAFDQTGCEAISMVPVSVIVDPEVICNPQQGSGAFVGPASLLIYPEFDNRNGVATILTVTNTSGTEGIDVEFVYRGRFGPMGEDLNCEEFDRTETLTPKDTLTVITNFHVGVQQQGYVYAFAKNQQGDPVGFNHLTGSLMMIDGLEFLEATIKPFAFRAVVAQLDLTDLDADGIRDLDGLEYQQVPDRIIVPSFFGSSSGPGFDSELILVNLSGGTQFLATANFEIFNDKGNKFTRQYAFQCWERVRLTEISTVFSQGFLEIQDNDPNELLGASQLEMGWFLVDGGSAVSTQLTIVDPAILAVLVERLQPSSSAELPFVVGAQDGHLLPITPAGDNSE